MSTPTQATKPSLDLDATFATAQEQVKNLITNHPGKIPVYTENGQWHFDDDAWAPGWTSGFLTGLIWIFAERTGDPWWREQAEKYSLLVEPRKHDDGTHDVGFLMTPSWGRWHELAPSEKTKDVLVTAGRTLAKSYNPAGKYLKTWVDDGSSFIDIMMNVGIIFQAGALSGDEILTSIAAEHSLTSRRYLVRGDSSTIHEGWFNPKTGEFLRAETHQGYRADSCWVRGLTWAIYGFGTAYEWTGDTRFLDTARHCADYYIERTGDRIIPPNDFDDPHPELQFEASAASIASSALLQLAELLHAHGQGIDAEPYENYARRTLARLSTPEFLGRAEEGWEGVIKQATYHRGNNLGVNESVMWGDYYFVEALHKLSKLTNETNR
ncbi:Unsaturated chondroitin disaccharide hydrolase [Arthrobacter sp. 9V]|uniref:glycoside hydrolase family 88 protein n=1 Tax=Arthrobacter sp. 9V TaxID=2653132 RepID=UPI0012F02E4F|nr:glycoside hydrolase family 88 protein [Arthrobacter sp. 9V]VXB65711.1 Unsaturated chondroitin disaccharide hydrolase [Arthrobacter sp. 9V]